MADPTLEDIERAYDDGATLCMLLDAIGQRIGDDTSDEHLTQILEQLQKSGDVRDFNPYHEPAGSPEGGQFASAESVGARAMEIMGLTPKMQEPTIYESNQWLGHNNNSTGRSYNNYNLNMPNAEILEGSNRGFNCFAWAVGDDRKWWGPEDHWPEGVNTAHDVVSFDQFFIRLAHGTRTKNENYERGFVKLALFTRGGDYDPTHLARQMSDGKWTSKLGNAELVKHTLKEMDGQYYGKLHTIYKVPEKEWLKLRNL